MAHGSHRHRSGRNQEPKQHHGDGYEWEFYLRNGCQSDRNRLERHGKPHRAPCDHGSSTTEYHYLDSSNTDRVITLNLQSFSVKTNFGCAGVVEYTGTASLPTSLSLPNGQQYQFTYEDTPGFTGYKTGRIKRVTLPTGGYYEYQYPASPNNGISCSDAGVNSLTRVINDGSASATWQFSRSSGTTRRPRSSATIRLRTRLFSPLTRTGI